MDELKACTKCGRLLTIESFHKNGKYRHSACKECRTKTSRRRGGLQATGSLRECGLCREMLPKNAFYCRGGNRLVRNCYSCTSVLDAMSTYGVTEQVARARKTGHCEVCGLHASESFSSRKGVRGLVIDHDHNTGEFRGLLCTGCNAALGMVKESKETLAGLILYLEKHKGA